MRLKRKLVLSDFGTCEDGVERKLVGWDGERVSLKSEYSGVEGGWRGGEEA
jgi:hypothetical protein